MSFYKFTNNDLFVNQTETHPNCRFDVYNSEIFYNKLSKIKGIFTGNVTNVPVGHIDLYEMNVDRNPTDTGLVSQFIYKDRSRTSYKYITDSTYNAYAYGDKITNNYPMSSSIVREFFDLNHFSTMVANNNTLIENEKKSYRNQNILLDPTSRVRPDGLPAYQTGDYALSNDGSTKKTSIERYNALKLLLSSSHINSLRNTINSYSTMSPHFAYSASFSNGFGRDLDKVAVNLVSIPSIFYGSEIKKGTINLKFYITGTLVAEAQDINQNGELVQVGPYGSAGSGSVAGLALYKQGFMILTGSWDLAGTSGQIDYKNTGTLITSSWLYYAVGANDGIPTDGPGAGTRASASYTMEFAGTHEIPVMTMFAHAKKGELNYSNNPTYISHSSDSDYYLPLSSSISYREIEKNTVNVVSSSFSNTSASFAKETYISKIGIYDKNKNLIGIATLAKPVKKTEDREFTFKLKLDL